MLIKPDIPIDMMVLPRDIKDLPLRQWNKGVFSYEVVKQSIVSTNTSASSRLEEGTYAGTQLALTEMFDRIERSYGSYFDVLGIEPSIPRAMSLEQKQELYKYQPHGKDSYPPHLDSIPHKDQVSQFQIFDKLGLVEATTLLPNIVPKTFVSTVAADIVEKFRTLVFGDPEGGFTMADVEANNRKYRRSGTDCMRGANIGDYADWYSDARFGQQQLTGVDPVTITRASAKWIGEFHKAAQAQHLDKMANIINSEKASSLYIQDYSYFREAMRLKPTETLQGLHKDQETQYGCASVCLFQLSSTGLIHPLAIIVDYLGTIDNSVVIFNERLSSDDPTVGESWPWRYAKTAVQCSAWTRHEIVSHLTHTHLIEEAIIVATHRCIPEESIIFQLLEPHWFRTLSLNAAARETLVPNIILKLVGYTVEQGMKYIDYEYHSFDFVGRYIPNDLQSRGFPVKELNSEKFKNYAYGRNMVEMWSTIRKFVAAMIGTQYKHDRDVASDTNIQRWCSEIQSEQGAQIKTFPTIKTVEDLVDAITMCIHIASPQHTAVNYLQSFYQVFVVNRPPCFYSPIPKDLSSLQKMKEKDFIHALPVSRQREWLLAAHIPWLLSFRPADDNNLINYAASMWNLYKKKHRDEDGPAITKIAAQFYLDLLDLTDLFQKHSDQMTKGTIPYNVMDPSATAVSILI